MTGMARKQNMRTGRPKGTEPPKDIIIALKGSVDFETWFTGLVAHCRDQSGWPQLPASNVVEKGLHSLAREVGYDRPPPKR
jgi:hypothetical protein